MAKDYYSILGIPRSATEKEIKAAFRKLARKFHPDVNPNDKTAEAKFKEVSEANEVLGDTEKRALYDQYGDHWEHVQQNGGVPPEPTYNFGGGQGGPVGFESIFEHLFSGRGRVGTAQGANFDFNDPNLGQPRDVEKTIEIPLDEIDQGSKRVLSYQTIDGVRTREGISTIPTTKKVEITIPAGISDGKKLRVPGKGVASFNGKAGDLFVTIKWAKHPHFKPNGENLETEVDVAYTLAALGGEVTVNTLRGSVKMKVPEGAQSGQTFRLGGQGITRLKGGRGDLLAKIRITVPKTLSAKERALLTELSQLEPATR